MSLYTDYLEQIETRKGQDLHPKPIEDAPLVQELIALISTPSHEHREQALDFFIRNTLPGTTSAAGAKAQFLKEVVLGTVNVPEITPAFAFELLSHMKGGPSVRVLLDLALGNDDDIAQQAASVLKTQVFLYDADTDRLKAAHEAGSAIATDILQSYVQAEFFTLLPEVDETVQVVTFVIAVIADSPTRLHSAERTSPLCSRGIPRRTARRACRRPALPSGRHGLTSIRAVGSPQSKHQGSGNRA